MSKKITTKEMSINNLAIVQNPRKFSVGLVAIVILVTTNAVTLYYYAHHSHSVKNLDVQYPYIDISREFINQENYIVNIQPLRDTINTLTDEFEKEHQVSASVYIEYLNTGSNISIHPDKSLWPASLAKVPLAMAVMKKIEDGQWRLDNKLVLMEGDANSESGDSENLLSEYPIGTSFTIEELLKKMIIESDNTAYFILQRNMHDDEIMKVVDEIGLEELFTDEGRVSAKEYSRLFRALYTSSFLKREHSQMLLKWLDESSFNDFLSYDIEAKAPFPHKFGEKITLNVYADSGIVYIPDRPYLITVLVESSPQLPYLEEKQKAAEFMRHVSNETYTFFSEYKK